MRAIRTSLLAALLLFATSAGAQQQFADIGDLELESGEVLENVQVGYITAGTLNTDRSNVIVFLTWFTGTARNLVDAGAIGPGALANTDDYYVIAIDALANGVSTSPSNSAAQDAAAFPTITIGDMVNSQHRLLTEHLDFQRVHAVIGISMGGMQAFDWIGRFPDFMVKAVAIDGSLRMTSYDLLAFGARKRIIGVMREAGHGDVAISSIIEHVSQITLRTPEWFVANVSPDELDDFLARDAASVYNSFDYEAQQGAMVALDLFGDTDLSRRSWAELVKADVLIINGSRDHMVNPASAIRAAQLLDAQSVINDSNCGHLGNICEIAAVSAKVQEFLK
ncbi:MAG: alpha/beta fold hydrolase [Woeseiaceae bacterium]|nr:alpha/beta fold hydrolase [Woeseiaceae bacterium]